MSGESWISQPALPTSKSVTTKARPHVSCSRAGLRDCKFWCIAMKMHIAIEVKVNVAGVITALSGFVFTIAVICQSLN